MTMTPMVEEFWIVNPETETPWTGHVKSLMKACSRCSLGFNLRPAPWIHMPTWEFFPYMPVQALVLGVGGGTMMVLLPMSLILSLPMDNCSLYVPLST